MSASVPLVGWAHVYSESTILVGAYNSAICCLVFFDVELLQIRTYFDIAPEKFILKSIGRLSRANSFILRFLGVALMLQVHVEGVYEPGECERKCATFAHMHGKWRDRSCEREKGKKGIIK